MDHKEITRPNIDTIYDQLIDSIIKKAQELSVASKIINRRELVDYLNSLHNGVLKEGTHIKQLIKDAYQKATFSKSVQEALINNIIENDGKNKIFDPSRADDAVFCLDIENPKVD